MVIFSQKCCFVQPKAIAPSVSLFILGMSFQLLFTFVFNPYSFLNYFLFVLSHAHIKYPIPTSFNFLLYFSGCTPLFFTSTQGSAQNHILVLLPPSFHATNHIFSTFYLICTFKKLILSLCHVCITCNFPFSQWNTWIFKNIHIYTLHCNIKIDMM